MKVLIYSSSFYPNIGGIELLTFNLAKSFKKLGNEVIVLTNTNTDEVDTGLQIISNPTKSEYFKYYNWCDVLYMPNLSLKIVWLLFINPFKKWVISHNTWYFDPENPNYFVSFVKQLFLFKAINISVSHVLAKSIWAKSTVIHNCYNNEIFKNFFLPRSKDFLFVGRLVSSKGCLDLIQSFAIVLQSFPNATLSIVGSGPDDINIRKLVSELSIGTSIFFLGAKSQAEIALIMNSHKCLLVPSIGSEAYGIVVLEALSCGCIVITSDSTGLVEAGNKFTIKYEVGNIVEMTNQMKLVLNNSMNHDLHHDELNDYLEIHRMDEVAKKYLKILSKA